MSVPSTLIIADNTGKAGLDAETALANGGHVHVYDLSDNPLGVTAALPNPAFNPASVVGGNAQATLATTGQTLTISASGTIAYGVLHSSASAEVLRGPAGVASGVFQFNNLTVVAGINGTLTGITLARPLHP